LGESRLLNAELTYDIEYVFDDAEAGEIIYQDISGDEVPKRTKIYLQVSKGPQVTPTPSPTETPEETPPDTTEPSDPNTTPPDSPEVSEPPDSEPTGVPPEISGDTPTSAATPTPEPPFV
jgi:beta-lactam-binding protein with PASTA domain